MDLYDELPQSSLLCDPEFAVLLDACARNRITTIDFLTLNAGELARLSQRSVTEALRAKKVLLSEFDAQFAQRDQVRPLSELPVPQQFTSGDMDIDEALGGGIHTHAITEVFGESSTGKSQLLMQLCLSVQLPKDQGGLGAKCVYITTEGDLPTARLEGILAARPELQALGVSQKNIYTVSCLDLLSQEHILNVQLPVLLERAGGDIRLIIIDSISHHMRVELETKSFRESQENRAYVDKMAEALLRLANKHAAAVVVANQVGDKPLVERAEGFVHNFTDYDYQMGWLVGWSDSTIRYRQNYTDEASAVRRVLRPSHGTMSQRSMSPNSSVQDLLSDDEDYMLIEREASRLGEPEQNIASSTTNGQGDGRVLNAGNKRTSQNNDRSAGQPPRKMRPRKKRLDIRVPNLGLSWANHVSTRILLKKAYKASPMVKRGELKFYQGSDPAAFWQVRRTLQVVYSTFSQPNQVSFTITKKGIEVV